MKELVSIETGKGRRKKTRVFVNGQEMLFRKDLSKENQGKRLAPKPPIYGDEKIKIGSDQERWTAGTKYGIVEGSYKSDDVIQDEKVRDEPMDEQRQFEMMGQEKDIRRRIL